MVIAFSRCLIIKGRMTPFKVGVDILFDRNSCFLDIIMRKQWSGQLQVKLSQEKIMEQN